MCFLVLISEQLNHTRKFVNCTGGGGGGLKSEYDRKRVRTLFSKNDDFALVVLLGVATSLTWGVTTGTQYVCLSPIIF